MKCLNCSTDSKLSERVGGACPKCHHAFAFEPTAGDPLTDLAFKTAIDAVSAHETVRFGADHLYHEVARRTRRRGRSRGVRLLAWGAAVLLLGLLILALGDDAEWPAVLLVLGAPGGVLVALGWRALGRARLLELERDTFDGWVARWVRAHGPIRGLIVPRPEPARRGRHRRAELEHYSFDRAVICDRQETVDLLIANNFHFENNCAVLSVGGYPPHVFESVLVMLRKNPRLTIYALHDASAAGCALASTLASDPRWFKGHGRVIDVGLRPGQAARLRGAWRRADRPAPPPPLYDRAEHRWLARYALDLAALRPEQVLKRLFRAMTPAASARHTAAVLTADALDGLDDAVGGGADADGGGVLIDPDSFDADAGASDGGDDGFG